MLLLNIRNPPLADQAAGLNYRLFCRYIRGQKSTARLGGAQILGSRFACPAIGDDFESNLLPLLESAQAGAFDGADMNEHILAALVRRGEAEALTIDGRFSELWQVR
jgi:hypothetical protein